MTHEHGNIHIYIYDIYIYTDLLYIVCGHYLRVDGTLLKSFVNIVQ